VRGLAFHGGQGEGKAQWATGTGSWSAKTYRALPVASKIGVRIFSAFLRPDTDSMQINDIPFGTTEWSSVERVEYPGERGVATWRTREFGGIRVRMVDYSAGYMADHWCRKGHILLCLSGTLETELVDGRIVVLTPGMSYQVADGAEPHRSRTTAGATLFIVD
jgi:hypothetical protein